MTTAGDLKFCAVFWLALADKVDDTDSRTSVNGLLTTAALVLSVSGLWIEGIVCTLVAVWHTIAVFVFTPRLDCRRDGVVSLRRCL